MKLKRLLSVLDVCECTADPELDIRDISFDSRTTQPGDLFAAVCGYESDGHRFIGAAAERGAAVVLCQRKPEVEIPYILVADSRLALSRICCEFFDNPSRELTMIGVTGTNGKTTVTTLIKHMLEQCLHTKVGLIGTNANVIGDEVLHTEHTTPDAYELQKLLRRMVDAGCTHAVMEVSSHSLVLHRVEGIRFRVGIFTNLSQDHLDFHKTMEAYAAAKAQLFAQSDVGIVNADDDWAHVMLEHAKCPMHTYSAKRNDADLVAKDIRLSASGVRFVAMHGDAIARMRLGIPGMFSVYNALSVIACACALGISLDDCAAALDTAKPVKGRAEVLETDGDYAILIDYAVTPDAIDNILTTVREFAPRGSCSSLAAAATGTAASVRRWAASRARRRISSSSRATIRARKTRRRSSPISFPVSRRRTRPMSCGPTGARPSPTRSRITAPAMSSSSAARAMRITRSSARRKCTWTSARSSPKYSRRGRERNDTEADTGVRHRVCGVGRRRIFPGPVSQTHQGGPEHQGKRPHVAHVQAGHAHHGRADVHRRDRVVCLSVGFECMAEGEYGHLFCLAFALVFGAIGFLDDYEKLRKKQNLGLTAGKKLLLQLAAAVAFIFLMRRFGYVALDSLYIPFWNKTVPVSEPLYVIFAAFVIVGTVNSVNLTDGVDGLAASTTMPVCIFFAVISMLWGERFLSLGVFASGIAGGLLGFLIYNFHPAKVFMGDTGSLFLGGAVAALAFAYDMPLILVTLGIMYIIEALSDIIQVGYFKLTHGKRVFKMSPFHHHLEMGGWTGHKWKETQIVALFAGVTVLFAVLSFIGVFHRFGV